MSDKMTFPDTWEEYEKQYGFTDDEKVYTNGSRLIPSFRVKQWLDHLSSVEPRKGKWVLATNFPYGDNCYVCINCKVKLDSMYPNFCPNCGADMREGDKE